MRAVLVALGRGRQVEPPQDPDEDLLLDHREGHGLQDVGLFLRATIALEMKSESNY